MLTLWFVAKETTLFLSPCQNNLETGSAPLALWGRPHVRRVPFILERSCSLFIQETGAPLLQTRFLAGHRVPPPVALP